MEKVKKINILKFILALSILVSLTTLFFFKEGSITTALQLTMLCWSFYILCIPGFHGKIMLNLPFKFFTGKTLIYPELYTWIFALMLNIFFLTFNSMIYFKTLTTHLLYEILKTPKPFWLIIATSGLATFYRFIFGYQNFYLNKIRHFFLRSMAIILSLFVLLYLTYPELVILMNIRA